MYVELELHENMEAQKDIETFWFTKKRYIYRYLKIKMYTK